MIGKKIEEQINNPMKKIVEKQPTKKGLIGESTLRGGQKCCHFVQFSKGVHVWTLTMLILKHIFPIYVDYNTKNSIEKKILFSNLYCVISKCICDKKMYVIIYLKMQIYSKNKWNDF